MRRGGSCSSASLLLLGPSRQRLALRALSRQLKCRSQQPGCWFRGRASVSSRRQYARESETAETPPTMRRRRPALECVQRWHESEGPLRAQRIWTRSAAVHALAPQSATELNDGWRPDITQLPAQALPTDRPVHDAGSRTDGRSQPSPVSDKHRGDRAKEDGGQHVHKREAIQDAANQPHLRTRRVLRRRARFFSCHEAWRS